VGELRHFKKRPTESASSYISRFTDLLSQLSNQGENYSQMTANSFLLDGLDEGYQRFLGDVTRKAGQMTQKEVAREILAAEGLTQPQQPNLSAETALAANLARQTYSQPQQFRPQAAATNFQQIQSRPQNNDFQQNNSSWGCCSYCGADNHYVNGCRKKRIENPHQYFASSNRPQGQFGYGGRGQGAGAQGGARGSGASGGWAPAGGSNGQNSNNFQGGPTQGNFQGGSRGGNFQGGPRGGFANTAVVEIGQHVDVTTGSAEQAQVSSSTVPYFTWIFDSGATNHMTSESKWLSNLVSIKPKCITLGNGTQLLCTQSGTAKVLFQSSSSPLLWILHNVLYIPDLKFNLLSFKRLTEAGVLTLFEETDVVLLRRGGVVLGRFPSDDDQLYTTTAGSATDDKAGTALTIRANPVDSDRWHARCGHVNVIRLRFLTANKIVNGLPNLVLPDNHQCDSCALGKITRASFTHGPWKRSERPLGRIHADLMDSGLLSTSGARYVFVLTDDFSRYTTTYFLKHKSDAFKYFQIYHREMERQLDKKIQKLKTDNGGEFTSNEFTAYLQHHGIRHELTVPYTPEQNGVVERANRTLTEISRTITLAAKHPDYLWAEAFATATYLKNRLLKGSEDGRSPLEAFFGNKPYLGNLRIWGSQAVVLKNKLDGKMFAKGKRCIFVGYSWTRPAWRFFDLTTKEITESCNARFF